MPLVKKKKKIKGQWGKKIVLKNIIFVFMMVLYIKNLFFFFYYKRQKKAETSIKYFQGGKKF